MCMVKKGKKKTPGRGRHLCGSRLAVLLCFCVLFTTCPDIPATLSVLAAGEMSGAEGKESMCEELSFPDTLEAVMAERQSPEDAEDKAEDTGREDTGENGGEERDGDAAGTEDNGGTGETEEKEGQPSNTEQGETEKGDDTNADEETGEHTYQFKAVDAAGNTSAESKIFTVRLDQTPPVIGTLTYENEVHLNLWH